MYKYPYPTFQQIQEKRVPIIIRYSEEAGLRSYFLTAAKRIKDSNPDVFVEKRLIPTLEDNKDEDLIFEVIVDDKVIIGKPQCKWHGVSRTQNGGSSSSSGNEKKSNNGGGSGGNGNEKDGSDGAAVSSRVFGMSVFISMKDVDDAIAKARRKRRPNSAYSQQGTMAKGVGLEILRGDEASRSKSD